MSRKLTTEQFIENAKKVHGSLYSYAKTEYQTAHTKVVITCQKHGDFSQSPASHVGQAAGCPWCAEEIRRVRRMSSQERFLQQAREAHGDRYDYSNSVYTGFYKKLTIRCHLHGEFEQTPANHFHSSGCQACSTSGYRVSLPGWIYVLVSGKTTKVGVTNRTAELRISEIRKRGGPQFYKVFDLYCEDGKVILDVETKILKYLSSNYERTSEIYQGSTECFLNVETENLIQRIQQEVESRLM